MTDDPPHSDPVTGLDALDLPTFNSAPIRRAAWLGVARAAVFAVVAIVVLASLWARVVAPAIAQRGSRDDLIVEQIKGAVQSLEPSSRVAGDEVTVNRDGSLKVVVGLEGPDPSGAITNERVVVHVSLQGVVSFEDGADGLLALAGDSELLGYSNATEHSTEETLDAVARLPEAARVSLAVLLDEPLDDNSATELWRELEASGVEPSGYLLAADAPGNPRGWSGPELASYREWAAAVSSTGGIAVGSNVLAVAGPDAGAAPQNAVLGIVVRAIPVGDVAALLGVADPASVRFGPVGLSLEED